MKLNTFKFALALLVSSLASAAWAAAPTLTGGSTSGLAGSPVMLPISFNPNGSSVVGMQFTLTVPTGITLPQTNPTAGSILGPSVKMIASNIGSTSATYLVLGTFDPSFTGSCTGNASCGNINTISNGT